MQLPALPELLMRWVGPRRKADGLGRWIPNLRVVKLPHAPHWVMRTEPVRVLNELLAFFNER